MPTHVSRCRHTLDRHRGYLLPWSEAGSPGPGEPSAEHTRRLTGAQTLARPSGARSEIVAALDFANVPTTRHPSSGGRCARAQLAPITSAC